MQEVQPYDKGLGNAALYASINPAEGQFWDWSALAWSETLTANCQAFMAEFDDTSPTTSYYISGEITPPSGGPWIIKVSTALALENVPVGTVIATDLVLTGPPAPPAVPSVPVSGIISIVGQQLWDASNIQWPPAVLLWYLNYAVREIINLKPEAGNVLGIIPLVAGTRQTVPATWNDLVNLKRNMGADGATPGLAITEIPVDTIDHTIPDWHTWPADPVVRYVIDDDRDPRSFDVFPPQPAATSQQVEAIGSAYPTKVTDPVSGAFPLTAEYEVPAADYMIYRALYESTSIPNALAKATSSLNKFMQYLGAGKQATTLTKANQGGL